jgi:ribonuclease HII
MKVMGERAAGSQMTLAMGMEKTSQFRAFETENYARGFCAVAGVDEVGRGPLAGPVVAAAVILPVGFAHPEIRDSKLLSAKQRGKMAPVIRAQALCWGVGVVGVDEIDRINILQASLLAMVKALDALELTPDCVLIDGNQSIPVNLLCQSRRAPEWTPYQKAIVKGDQLCLSIAAASIVAKVARDEMMIGYDEEFPQYGFAGHKGYACAAHLAALRRHGPSPIHRKSFAPVREVMNSGAIRSVFD